MLGSRVGSRGALYGSSVGSGSDDEGPGTIWTLDETSGKAVPTEAEWVANGYSPKNLYTFQEASGNILDQIGTGPLVTAGAPMYSQAVAGWTRAGLRFTEVAGQRATATANVPEAADDVAVLAYMTMSAAGDRDLLGFGTGAFFLSSLNIGDNLEWRVDGSFGSSGSSYLNDGVVPLLLVNNRDAGTARIYTHRQKLSPAYSLNGTGTVLTFGANVGGVGGSATSFVVYGVTFEGVPARFTDASAHALLTSLRWAPSWSP